MKYKQKSTLTITYDLQFFDGLKVKFGLPEFVRFSLSKIFNYGIKVLYNYYKSDNKSPCDFYRSYKTLLDVKSHKSKLKRTTINIYKCDNKRFFYEIKTAKGLFSRKKIRNYQIMDQVIELWLDEALKKGLKFIHQFITFKSKIKLNDKYVKMLEKVTNEFKPILPCYDLAIMGATPLLSYDEGGAITVSLSHLEPITQS